MDLEDHLAPLDIRTGDHHLAIETAGPQQGRVENIGTVGGGDQDDALVGFETVHLHQKLVEGLLALVVSAPQAGAAMTPDGIDFIDEDDAGGALLPLEKQVANPAGADTDEHLDKVGAGDGEKRYSGLASNGPGQQGFAGARRSHQQYTFRNPAPQLGKFLGILEKRDDLVQ